MLPREVGERSLGFLETTSLARGVVCADEMVKVAPVRLALLAAVSGGKMLVAVDGQVAPVESALARGVAVAGSELLDALFLANLHPDVPAALQRQHDRRLDDSLGLVETTTAAAIVRAADAARKAAAVRIVRLRLALGLSGKGFLQLTGEVAAVEAAVAAAAAVVQQPEFLIRTEVLPLPHRDLRQWLQRTLGDDLLPFDPPVGD